MTYYLSYLQVEKLVLINASVYGEGTGDLAKLPTIVAQGLVSFKIIYHFVKGSAPY